MDHSWYGEVNFAITKSRHTLAQSDVVVICSPHTQYKQRPSQKVFCFAQMAEHLFRDYSKQWRRQCEQWYKLPYPKIYGSEWIADLLHGECYYLEDGINTDHFPIERPIKDSNTVLVEGWECSNDAKDVDAIGCKVAERLKHEGYKIISYGFQHATRYVNVPDEYYYRPSLETMNDLYRRSSVLIKATKYDSRALSPIEAMTKQCPTARAIIQGDDYLQHEVNCLRSGYDEDELYNNAVSLLSGHSLNMSVPDWNPIIRKLENILCS